jgi:starch phosphorylase
MNQLYDRYLGPSWREEPANSDVWSRARLIPAEELWRTHERRRERLVAWARRRVRAQRIRRSAPEVEISAADEILDPEAMTIGFARRFATYKRATLILRDLPRLQRMLHDDRRPVQLIFSGKAHPRDDAGKELIREVTAFTRDRELGRRVVFLEDYDMAVARYLVQGVDVWLNTPRRPNEASGTSGMKAAANGALNLSTLDGWWEEVAGGPEHVSGHGWSIGKAEVYGDPAYQDQVEADTLYDLLERDVIPTFYDRGPDHLPRKWIEHMRTSISSLCKFVNTHRMVSEYMCCVYLDAHRCLRRLDANDASRARGLTEWLARVRRDWRQVSILSVEAVPSANLLVGIKATVRARVQLGPLTPDDIIVELCHGRVNPLGEMEDARITPMNWGAHDPAGNHLFCAETQYTRSGLYGYTVRLRPTHPDLPGSLLPGLICWAEGSAAT